MVYYAETISGFVDNNIRKLCPGYFRQFFWIQADGSTDSAATDIDFIEVFRTVMDEGREEFLHSQRTAAAPDIAGDICDFFNRNKFHRLLDGYFRRL